MSIKRLVPLNLPALDTLPTGARKGDLAYKNSDDKVYVYDGDEWVIASGSGGGGGVVTLSPTEPVDPVNGQIWVDSDSDVPTALNPYVVDGGSPSSTYVPGGTLDGGSP